MHPINIYYLNFCSTGIEHTVTYFPEFYYLSDEAGEAEPGGGADTVVVAVGPAALARHQRLHVAQAGGGRVVTRPPAHPLPATPHHHHHARRLGQQRHTVGL